MTLLTLLGIIKEGPNINSPKLVGKKATKLLHLEQKRKLNLN